MKALLLSFLLTSSFCLADQGVLSKAFTPEQQAATGINKLTDAEQQNLLAMLDSALNARVKQAAQPQPQPRAQPAPQQVAALQAELDKKQKTITALAAMLPISSTVHSVTTNGSHVLLENGMIWKVQEGDQTDSEQWTEGEEIVIIDGSTMINLDNMEKVDARRVK